MPGKNNSRKNGETPARFERMVGGRLAIWVRRSKEDGTDELVVVSSGTMIWENCELILDRGDEQGKLELGKLVDRINDVQPSERGEFLGCAYELKLHQTSPSWISADFVATKDIVRNSRFAKNLLFFLSLISIPVSLVLVWYLWFEVLPQVWTWGFVEPTALEKGSIARFFNTGVVYLATFFAVICLAALPIYAPVGAVIATMTALSLYAEAETAAVTETLDRDSKEQARVEDELKREMKNLEDVSGLVSMLRYSRVQLKPYYKIGLSQTHRSFRYSVMAMWIGFVVILLGIVLWFIEPETLQKIGLKSPDETITQLVIISGAIIEMISALFLFVYRSSIKQLNYFYDRQMYNHSVLMCHRITATMSDSSDDAKKDIIKKILDKPWTMEQDELPSSKSLKSLLPDKAKAS